MKSLEPTKYEYIEDYLIVTGIGETKITYIVYGNEFLLTS